jgi:hypothetical protein
MQINQSRMSMKDLPRTGHEGSEGELGRGG